MSIRNACNAGENDAAARCPLNAARYPLPTRDSPARGDVKA
jgi:hypothetical protein